MTKGCAGGKGSVRRARPAPKASTQGSAGTRRLAVSINSVYDGMALEFAGRRRVAEDCAWTWPDSSQHRICCLCLDLTKLSNAERLADAISNPTPPGETAVKAQRKRWHRLESHVQRVETQHTVAAENICPAQTMMIRRPRHQESEGMSSATELSAAHTGWCEHATKPVGAPIAPISTGRQHHCAVMQRMQGNLEKRCHW